MALTLKRIDPRDRLEYDYHYKVLEVRDDTAGLFGYIALHRLHPGNPCFGTTRIFAYNSADAALDDALRHSRVISHASALMNIPCGGAKATLVWHPDSGKDRDVFLRAFAKAVDALHGEFVTAGELGLTTNDLAAMKKETSFVSGCGDDAKDWVAEGVYEGMKASLKQAFGDDAIGQRSFAIQGLGHVGGALFRKVYDEALSVCAADTDDRKISDYAARSPRATFLDSGAIHTQRVDVFSPCATPHTINVHTISHLQCAVIAGSAQNQLAMEAFGLGLLEKGVVYAPDYVISAGGLIAAYDEFVHGGFDAARVRTGIKAIPDRLEEIFAMSKEQRLPTNAAANAMAHRVFDLYTDADSV